MSSFTNFAVSLYFILDRFETRDSSSFFFAFAVFAFVVMGDMLTGSVGVDGLDACCSHWTICSISGGRLASLCSQIIALLLSSLLLGTVSSLARVLVSFMRQISLDFMPDKSVITSLKHS